MNTLFLMRTSARTSAVLGAAMLGSMLLTPAMACDEKTTQVISADADASAIYLFAGGSACCDRTGEKEASQKEEEVTYLRAVGAAHQLDEAKLPPQSSTGVWTVSSDSAKEQAIELRYDNGELSIRLNGEKIPENRIKRDGGRVILLDESGEEMADLHLRLEGMSALTLFSRDDGGGRFGLAQLNEQPPVMLGIHMEEPGPALAAHLDFEADRASLITALYEGLPAHKAGLGQYDVIIRFDDESAADPASLRNSLKEKNPGDVLRLEVIQKGKRKTVEVELEKYDTSKMQGAGLIGEAGASFGTVMPFLRQGRSELHLPDAQQWDELLTTPGWHDLLVTPDREIFEWAPELHERFRGRSMVPPGEGGEVDRKGRSEQLEKRLEDLTRMLQEAEQRREHPDASSSLDRLEERLRKLEQRLDKLLERAQP